MLDSRSKPAGVGSLCNMAAVVLVVLAARPGWAGENPFFITYTHQMEEPRNLEIASKSVTGMPADGNRFWGEATEFEYGVRGWWTTEVYLDGQATSSESALFTGYRWENRFRLLSHEHWINPVLYAELENINGADKSLLEVVNHDGNKELTGANGQTRSEKKREIEAKLILSSYYRGWTIAENFIAEKNIRHEPYEFGYAFGISRPIGLLARPDRCSFCAENFQIGVEMYGGLGTHDDFGWHGTSHYVAPTVAWTVAHGTTLKVSPGFGVTETSARFLFRFGVFYEIDQFGRSVHGLFHSPGGRR